MKRLFKMVLVMVSVLVLSVAVTGCQSGGSCGTSSASCCGTCGSK